MSHAPRLRLALIGCGYFARYHAAAWRMIPEVELVSVCDLEMDRARAFGERFRIPLVYDDPLRLFTEQKLDIVDIVTSPESHRALVELAAKHRVHVICQKPMALTEDDCLAMVQACEQAGVIFMVHENFRWQRIFRRAKTLAHVIGEPFFLRLWFRSRYDVFSRQPYLAKVSRFIILDLGVHLLDLARFLLGDSFSSVYCVARRINQRIQGEDVATLLLRSHRDAAAVVELSYASFAPRELFPQTLALLEGTAGSVIVEPDGRLVLVTESGVHEVQEPRPSLPWQELPGEWIQESVLAIQRHFVECLQAGQQPETNGRDNLETMRLVFAAYRSSEIDAVVSLV